MKHISNRNKSLSVEELNCISKHVKDNYSYLSLDPLKEYELFDQRMKQAEKDPEKLWKKTSIQSPFEDHKVTHHHAKMLKFV